ncbi:MAG: hypothetical protein IAA31_02325 [Candidatus Anaerobiospirillum merdipullorum]|uniref:Type III secretion chaperone SycN n=1 Tax=Candidatus Anaerobiospirillum merdipullorum TaxID=2838450 RepID=A0A9E2KLL8_9GAMM|nr:hypothetical protein [Candidatus Anaerobiospirillum merdipullorum]
MMTSSEVANFFALMGLPPLDFAPGRPINFILNESLELSLEYNEEDNIVIVLSSLMPPYAYAKLEKALRAASYMVKRQLDFTVGYSRDKLLLLTEVPGECSAQELLAAVESLMLQNEQLEA